MPKQPSTPQITTPVPPRLKEAWEKECIRLKWAVPGVAYAGDVQKGLIALFLAENNESKRNEIAATAIKEYQARWAESKESVPGGTSMASLLPLARAVRAIRTRTADRNQ